ncbi:MAG: DUF3293 domain-containing protein [Castellaniella sp.]
MTVLDEMLLRAYRQTDYHVFHCPAFVLRVDEHHADLAALHRHWGVDCSAYITACNPHSRLLTAAENRCRQLVLESDLRQAGHAFLRGIGRHPGQNPGNDWPGEDSVLVLGLTREEAAALGRRHEQNAILWSGPDAVMQLFIL